jgi:hypothetical protein
MDSEAQKIRKGTTSGRAASADKSMFGKAEQAAEKSHLGWE